MKPSLLVFSLALLVFRAVDIQAIEAVSCEALVNAMKNVSVDTISLPVSLTLNDCVPTPAQVVTISRTLVIESSTASVLQIVNSTFLDHFLISGQLQLTGLHIIAPASSQLTTDNGFIPFVFQVSAGGVVTFTNCSIMLSTPDAHSFSAELPAALGAFTALTSRPASPDLSNVPLRNLKLIDGANWTANAVAALLASPPLKAQLAACTPQAGWHYIGTYVVSPTPYEGGTIVHAGAQAPTELGQAFINKNTSAIFIEADVDAGYFEGNNADRSSADFTRTSDLLLYGENGVRVDWKFARQVVAIEATLTVKGGLVFTRCASPSRSGLPYNMFLGQFLMKNGSVMVLDNIVVEHGDNSDLELWELAGKRTNITDDIPILSFDVSKTSVRQQATSHVIHENFKNLPSGMQPTIVQAGAGLVVESWALDSQVWTQSIYGSVNWNHLFSSYKLTNVSLTVPAPGMASLNECTDTTGVVVYDSATFKLALNDKIITRIKVTQDFKLQAADYPPSDIPPLGLNISRNIYILGCVPNQDYAVIDTSNLFRMVYINTGGFVYAKDIRWINIYQAPRRQFNEMTIGFFSTEDNGSFSLEACVFEGKDPSHKGPLLNNTNSAFPDSISYLLPSASSLVHVVDPSTQQVATLVTQWEIVITYFFNATRGLLPSGLYGGWNYHGCLVATPAISGKGERFVDRHGLLALSIVLPFLFLAGILLAVLLVCRRRVKRQRNLQLKALAAASTHSSNEVTGSPMRDAAAASDEKMGDRIDAEMLKLSRNVFSADAWNQIKLGKCIGTGGFCKVYKGFWRGSVVAVKVIVLPEQLTRSEKFRRMSIMETAISSSLSHPNIIPTYTYAVRTLDRCDSEVAESVAVSTSASSPSASQVVRQPSEAVVEPIDPAKANDILSVACEIRLVQEFASMGTLRDCLDEGKLCSAGDTEGRQDFKLVLDMAMDICKALVHLHKENIVHCDLKASNVLILPTSSNERRVIAKIADFGMAQSMIHNQSHVSGIFHGTLTHMAPETLVSGHITFASDIYSMGIIMWELITRQFVQLSCLQSMLPFMVSARGLRPILPNWVPKPYADLVRQCWAGKYELRPTAEEVYRSLAKISADFAQGALGPCILKTSNTPVEAVNTEMTSDHVSTYLMAGMTTASTLDFVDELEEACTSLGDAERRPRGAKMGPSPSLKIGSVAEWDATAAIAETGPRDPSYLRDSSVSNLVDEKTASASAFTHENRLSSEGAAALSEDSGVSRPILELSHSSSTPDPAVIASFNVLHSPQQGAGTSGPDARNEIPEAAQPAAPSRGTVTSPAGTSTLLSNTADTSLSQVELQASSGGDNPLPRPHQAYRALGDPSKPTDEAIFFKTESALWDTFMLNHSHAGLTEGLGLTDIAEPGDFDSTPPATTQQPNKPKPK